MMSHPERERNTFFLPIFCGFLGVFPGHSGGWISEIFLIFSQPLRTLPEATPRPGKIVRSCAFDRF